MQMFFANGGGECYVITVGKYKKDIVPDDFKTVLETLKTLDEPTLIIFPDKLGDAYYSLCQTALQQCEDLKDRFVIIDVQYNATDRSKDIQKHFRDGLKYSF